MFDVLKTVSRKRWEICSLLVAGKWKHANRILFLSYIINEYWLGSLLYGAWFNFLKEKIILGWTSDGCDACDEIHAYIYQGYIHIFQEALQ